MNIQAPWVGKSPEEYHEETTNQKQFDIEFTMQGTISIFASSKEEALEQAKTISKLDLLDYVEETAFD